jgi:predicted transposase YbfD/YdcC
MTVIHTLHAHLRCVRDFRKNRKKLYPLDEILFLVTCGCLCGLEEWDEFVDFGIMRLDWLRQYAPYKHGIPSHDTLNRVFSLLDHAEFAKFFNIWVVDLVGGKIQGLVPIDGKALRGTSPRQTNAKKLLHTINAWSCEAGMSFGQTQVMGKGNELAGIRELLTLLDLQGYTLSIDAAGCQTDIAEQIIEAQADYILAVKGNQGELEAEITNAFNRITIQDHCTKTVYTGGRIETRTCEVIHHLDTYVDEVKRWKNSQTVIKMTTHRYIKTQDKETIKTRYFISSLNRNADDFVQAIQQHWEIENKLHWHLDVTFSEDDDRNRKKNAAANFSIARKIALNLLSKHHDTISLHRKQNKALMDEKYLESLFF